MTRDSGCDREARRQAREAWAAERTVGDHTAVFYPGEDLRCPGTRRLSEGGKSVCAAWLDGFRPKADSKVVVKALPHRFAVTAGAGLDKQCRDCGSTLEIFAILGATG